jgi:hypothetical protein
MDPEQRGAIHAEQAYALGKMLDHSSWQKGDRRLPRNITASDLDIPGVPMVFDNGGMMIFGELSRTRTAWSSLHFGQRFLYENLLRGTPHCAVLCCHEVDAEQGRKIDSRHDIAAFQIMVVDFGGVATWPLIQSNTRWQDFVFSWMENKQGPLNVRRRILGFSVGMTWRKPSSTNVVPMRGAKA